MSEMDNQQGFYSRHDACKVLQRLFREEVRLKTQLETLRQVDNNL